MGSFVKGMIIGLVLPSYLAFQYHRQMNATQEIQRNTSTYVKEMDRNVKTMERGLRLWKIGGNYAVVHDTLDKAVVQYDVAAAQCNVTLARNASSQPGLVPVATAIQALYQLEHLVGDPDK